jgi:hypothetical protein
MELIENFWVGLALLILVAIAWDVFKPPERL